MSYIILNMGHGINDFSGEMERIIDEIMKSNDLEYESKRLETEDLQMGSQCVKQCGKD